MRKNKKILLITTLVISLIIVSSLLGNQRNVKHSIVNKNNKENRNVRNYLSTSNSHTQEWNRTWGGSNYDEGMGVAVDSADNVYLAGYTYSFGAGSDDMILTKYNSLGVQQWNRTWGGSNYDEGMGVAVDSADNVYLAGYTESFGAGSGDMVLAKYNSLGVQQWNCTWGGSSSDMGTGVAVDSTDNVYLVGYTYSFGAGYYDMVLAKYNSLGVQQWNRTWGGSSIDEGTGVAVDSADNVYLAGYTYNFGAGSGDMVLAKYNSLGVQQWNCTWGGSSLDEGTGVAVDSADNVYLVGYTLSFGAGYYDMVLAKYNSLGVQQWNRTWGGSSIDEGTGVAVDSADNVYLAGYTYNFGAGSGDMVLAKYNSLGVQQWNCTWGGSSLDEGTGVAVDSADNVYLVGITSSFGAGSYDMVLVKFTILPRINIITPENITYTAPMSGYYPANYGFENDNNGDVPKGWNYWVSMNNPVPQVIASMETHNKVVEFYDQTSGGQVSLTQTFNENKTSGTIEFWFYTTDITQRTRIAARNSTSSQSFDIRVESSKWQYYNGSTWNDVPNVAAPQNNRWMHVRIDFECGNGGYLGLGNDEYYLTIDGIKSNNLPFSNKMDKIEIFILFSGVDATNFHFYIDAVGYSWDPNYNIGDNLYEGLLLSYESNINSDWWEYSLDSQNNVTILGNTTIPLPENGTHTIQVFGNSSYGMECQSEIRHFIIDYPIELITPESGVFTGPMSGYYPATYGFENDNNGDVPEGWHYWVSSINPVPQVIASMETHNKVVEFYDQTSGGQVSLTQTFNENKTSGTIEFWFYTTDITQRTRIAARNSTSSQSFDIMVESSKWQYYNGSTWNDVPNVAAPQNNRWMHVRIDFECGNGGYLGLGKNEYYLTIDGIKSNNLPFSNKIDKIETFILFSGVDATNFHYYLDAVGYSWDPNYNIGDNLNEGLLLSFENNTVLDWIGYSLDGQAYRTILGNCTFPLPENGPHSIKIFGNNSLGTIVHSNIRHFLVTIYPEIEIISPCQNEIFGSIAPNFEITVKELNLHSTWYSLDGGVTNITFSGLIGTIDQLEWDKKGDGLVIIRFYANDTGGLKSFIEVQVLKDTTDPIFTDTPSDFTVDYGYTGISISWTATDLTPRAYTIELQGFGIVVPPTTWLSGVVITYNVPNGLSAGTYLYTINITDGCGNSNDHTVVMTVKEEIPSGVIPFELILIVSTVIGGGAVIGIAVALFMRRRRKAP
ncbi:MAG: SBBP repeat-containing protein [Promethearchaeota archaeon]